MKAGKGRGFRSNLHRGGFPRPILLAIEQMRKENAANKKAGQK